LWRQPMADVIKNLFLWRQPMADVIKNSFHDVSQWLTSHKTFCFFMTSAEKLLQNKFQKLT
jgi:hypothetical protein